MPLFKHPQHTPIMQLMLKESEMHTPDKIKTGLERLTKDGWTDHAGSSLTIDKVKVIGNRIYLPYKGKHPGQKRAVEIDDEPVPMRKRETKPLDMSPLTLRGRGPARWSTADWKKYIAEGGDPGDKRPLYLR